MGQSSLKINSLPAALAHVGTAHNALVDLIKTAEGKGGIAVYASDGKILIDGSGISVTATTEGDPVLAVGSDGKLNRVVKHSTWETATTYPTELRAVAGGATTKANSSGLAVEGASLDFRHDPVAGIGGWYVGALKVEIDAGLITANMSIREIDVCDGGVAKKMLIIASEPYTP